MNSVHNTISYSDEFPYNRAPFPESKGKITLPTILGTVVSTLKYFIDEIYPDIINLKNTYIWPKDFYGPNICESHFDLEKYNSSWDQ